MRIGTPGTGVSRKSREALCSEISRCGAAGAILELGIDWGVVTTLLARPFQQRVIVGVDFWDRAYHSAQMRDDNVEDKIAHVKRLAAQYNNVIILKMNLLELAKRFIGPVAVLFFDASQRREELHKHFAAWLPNLAPAGIAIVHGAIQPEVQAACNEHWTRGGYTIQGNLAVFGN